MSEDATPRRHAETREPSPDLQERLRTRLTVAVCLLSSARVHIAQAERLSPEARARIVRHLDEAADVLVELPRDARRP